VIIRQTDPFTNKVNTRDIDVTAEQLDRWRNGGEMIQNVMPHLTPDEREFLMTGIMPESWPGES
jgi:GH24 family phage-related lysozyme (muramidase)